MVIDGVPTSIIVNKIIVWIWQIDIIIAIIFYDVPKDTIVTSRI